MKGYIAQRVLGHPVPLAVVRYTGAVLALAVGVLLASWLQSLIDASVVLLMAVLVAAWFSGLWPALLASVLATLALDYFFTPPLYTFALEIAHLPHLVVFTLLAGLFVGVSAARRGAERSLVQARDELEARVRERTADLTAAHAEAVAAQQRFRDLVNSIEGIVWEADAQTFQFTFVSKQAERVLGYPIAQWLAEPAFWKDHIHPEDRSWAVALCVSATAEKRDHDFEYRMVAADGRVVWLRDLVTVVVEGGRPARLRGVMLDVTDRKQADQALREQANLLDLTHDTVFVRDVNDVIRYWNRGAEELYGWTSAEAVGQVSHTLTQTLFPEPFERITEQVFQRGRWEGELVHAKRDGSRVTVASRWSLQRDLTGKPVGVLETNNDITERKRAEDKLRRSEANLAEAQRLSHIGSWVENLVEGSFTASPELCRICGYSASEPVTKEMLRQVIHPEDLPSSEQIVERSLRDRSDFEFEHRILRPDASIRHVHVIGHAVMNESGDVVEIIGSVADVTERKRAEAELRESERRHRHIFQATGVSIWEEDFSQVKAAIEDLKRGGVRDFRQYLQSAPEFIDYAISLVRIVDVNEATLKLFGAGSRNELVESLHKVFTPETRQVFAGELVAIAEGRTAFEGETVMKRLNGERIVVLFSVSFPPPDASFDAVLVSVMDITDRKRAEHELEELAGRLIHAQEQERSRIGRELHDHISQMLGVLTIRMDQLRAEETTPPHVAATLDELRQSTAEVTDDIHGLSHRLHSSALDYLGLVPAMQRLVNEFSSRHGIAIDFDHHALPATLPSEVSLSLFRVVEESLTNIAKHSQASSARVHVHGGSDGIHLTIDDSGKGFDVGSLEGRAGLGFVSMRERLRVLRGTVRVDSVPSRGTRIDVWVPAASLVSPAGGEVIRPGEPHAQAPSNVTPA